MTTKTALIVGASGIVGRNLATHLTTLPDWSVYGLARTPPSIDGVQPVTADLLNPASLREALAEIRPTDVFLSTWMRQPTEAENIRVNGAMVRNLLAALSSAASVHHVALVTGQKHYLGPFEAYGKEFCRRHRFAKTSRASISRISTMRRKTKFSLRRARRVHLESASAPRHHRLRGG